MGDPTGAITAARQAIENQNAWNATPSPIKAINAQDNTAGPVWSAQSNINSVQGKTVYIDVVKRMIGGAAGVIGFKDGTDYPQRWSCNGQRPTRYTL